MKDKNTVDRGKAGAENPESSPHSLEGAALGILDAADLSLIGERYGISVDPDNVTQYKLCQVIKGLENKLKRKSSEE